MRIRDTLSAVLAAAWLALAPAATAADAGKAEAHDQASPQPVTDAFIKGRIVSAFAFNPHVSAYELDVKIENGLAYISGKVDSPVERDLAIEVARGTEGVQDVRSTIEVVPGTRAARADGDRRTLGRTLDDAGITAAVKSRLLANENTGGLGIDVTTKNGVVALNGRVKSEAEKDLAGYIARNQEGVGRVDNRLAVGRR